MYSPDSIVNDLVLTIVNDGNGTECGMSYAARRLAVKLQDGVFQFRRACEHYNKRRVSVYECSESATAHQINSAADILRAYYVDHIKEG